MSNKVVKIGEIFSQEGNEEDFLEQFKVIVNGDYVELQDINNSTELCITKEMWAKIIQSVEKLLK